MIFLLHAIRENPAIVATLSKKYLLNVSMSFSSKENDFSCIFFVVHQEVTACSF